jgi:hypothetical protein
MRPDPETRFLSLATSAECKSDAKLWIFVSCSDATLRIFSYSFGGKLELMSELGWQEHCLLQARHIVLGEEALSCLLIATTGGEIHGLLEPTKEPQQHQNELAVVNKQVHQSGINSIDTLVDGCGGLILTGGDDNSLQLTEFRLEDGKLCFNSLWQCETAHAAQITGVTFMGKIL